MRICLAILVDLIQKRTYYKGLRVQDGWMTLRKTLKCIRTWQVRLCGIRKANVATNGDGYGHIILKEF